jgi:hypothetical protein
MMAHSGAFRSIKYPGCTIPRNTRVLLIDWMLGTIVVTGPKAWDFCDQLCLHRATLLKADGKDILLVTIALNPG